MIGALEALGLIFCVLILLIWWREKRPRNFPPGPVGLPILGYMPYLYPDTLDKIEVLRRKYGNIFSLKIGADWFVVLNDLDSMKHAFIRDDFAGRPRHMLFMVNNKFGIGYNEGPAWHEQRKFTVQQMKELGFEHSNMETLIQYEVNDLIHHLQETRAKKPVDLKDILGASILNLSWLMTAGVKFRLDDRKLHGVFDSVRMGFIEPALKANVYFLPWIAETFENLTGYKTLKNSLRRVDDAVKEIIIKHKETYVAGQRRDFVDAYLDKMSGTSDKESSFYGKAGGDNIVDTIGNLFIASTVSITSTLAFAILYLTDSRAVLKKMQIEIAKVTSNLRVPSYTTDRTEMPYTEAVIQEVMRLSSISAGATLHSTTTNVEFMGYTIPKGTVIMPNMYAVHHNKEYWGDPETFRPERFINPDGTFRKDEMVNPFGVGKRACVAKNTAPMQIFQYLTSIVQAFDFYEHPDYPLPSIHPEAALVLNPSRYRVVLIPRNESPPRRFSSYMPNGF